MRDSNFHINHKTECITLLIIYFIFEYKHNEIFKIYHNHRRGEARRKSRRLRSRIRRRLRASGGATGGAQFSAATGSSSIGGNSVMSQPGFYSDYRQVKKISCLQISQLLCFNVCVFSGTYYALILIQMENYVQYGTKGLQIMRKSDSDKGPISNGSKSESNSPNTPKRKGSKKHR